MAEKRAKLHSLKLEPKIRGKGFIWNCVCGQDAGEGLTEEACKISYARHVQKENLRTRSLNL